MCTYIAAIMEGRGDERSSTNPSAPVSSFASRSSSQRSLQQFPSSVESRQSHPLFVRSDRFDRRTLAELSTRAHSLAEVHLLY